MPSSAGQKGHWGSWRSGWRSGCSVWRSTGRRTRGSCARCRAKLSSSASSSQSRGCVGVLVSFIVVRRSGGSGIRTHEVSPPAGFQDRCIQPLCHPSIAHNIANSGGRAGAGPGHSLIGRGKQRPCHGRMHHARNRLREQAPRGFVPGMGRTGEAVSQPSARHRAAGIERGSVATHPIGVAEMGPPRDKALPVTSLS